MSHLVRAELCDQVGLTLLAGWGVGHASQRSQASHASYVSSKTQLSEDRETYGCECGANSHGDDFACDKCDRWFHQWSVSPFLRYASCQFRLSLTQHLVVTAGATGMAGRSRLGSTQTTNLNVGPAKLSVQRRMLTQPARLRSTAPSTTSASWPSPGGVSEQSNLGWIGVELLTETLGFSDG